VKTKTLLSLAVIAITLTSGIAQASNEKLLHDLTQLCASNDQVASKKEMQACRATFSQLAKECTPSKDCDIFKSISNAINVEVAEKTAWAKTNGLLDGAKQ